MKRTRTRTPLTLTAAVLAAAVAGGAATAGAASASTPDPLPRLDPAMVRASIGGLPDASVTGALVKVTGSAGRWSGTSGLGDIHARTPVPLDGRFRVGSISKVFTAVVVLQLAAEHRLDLDQSVQHYMPGLLPAGYPRVTVRQLLDHTSGLPTGGHLGEAQGDPKRWFVDHRFDSWTPRQIVTDAMTTPMDFAPGTSQRYNGLNYYVAGMLIEKVTGRTYAHEVRNRILQPLNLRATYVLDRHDPRLPGPHSHGYVAVTEKGGTVLHDVSEQSPYPWAEGGMISSADDLTRFIRAIFQGRVVPRSMLPTMFAVPDVKYADDSHCNLGSDTGHACFSAGLMRVTLPNGVTVWGKTGSRPGYTSGMFATRDLRRVAVYSLNPTGGKDGSEAPYVNRIAAAVYDPDLLPHP
ncbi:class A beta-lactamase-related serine hydrolase [Actinomadura logoneensis]|uniref:Class A beta-lactamase-related serine hydrolase n=1 Tax=Actinomadura logoneensis TaxID=2293572 RepID=A0A372JNV5_9ACTN|nr:serine hydrolase domain-containing protein [Actinomadura logoneensis]RFU41705.1 class A beta-lactamase-related serine hydrolase [Actinomadura logoneensis]